MFCRGFLSDLSRRAMRRGVWYRALDGVERGVVYLVVRVVDRVRSPLLGGVLAGIVRKLSDAMKSDFVRRMEEYGLRKAREVVKQAVEWGYSNARGCIQDLEFIRYLTCLEIYSSYL